MSDRQYNTLFLLTLIVGIAFGLVIGGILCSENWIEAFQKWQTLIAGTMAVAAALITILVMQKSDDRADERHQDLRALTLRRDAILINRVWRTLDDHYSPLRNKADSLRDEGVDPDDNVHYHLPREEFDHYFANMDKLKLCTTTDDFSECAKLWDFGDTRLKDNFRNALGSLKSACNGKFPYKEIVNDEVIGPTIEQLGKLARRYARHIDLP